VERPPGRDGRPTAIQDSGSGTREEDVRFRFAIVGHYQLWAVLEPIGGGSGRFAALDRPR